MDLLLLGVVVSVPIIIIIAYVLLLRSRHHYTSILACPNCKGTFEYSWVPLMSFSTVRLGKDRYLECPLCHKWGLFNIWDTRTAPGEKASV